MEDKATRWTRLALRVVMSGITSYITVTEAGGKGSLLMLPVVFSCLHVVEAGLATSPRRPRPRTPKTPSGHTGERLTEERDKRTEQDPNAHP